MFSVNHVAGILRRARQGRPRPGHQSQPVPSTPRLGVETLEDRLCPSGGYLVVASLDNDSLLRYDESTGAFVDQIDPKNLGNLKAPGSVLFGPDHNLYVSDRYDQVHTSQHAVLQYDGTTGAFLSVFASQNLSSPRGFAFGPDGNLYVLDGGLGHVGNATIDRFDGKTGAFLDYYVPVASGGLAHPSQMLFGPDGNIYVSEPDKSSILRYYGPDSATPGAPDPAPGQTGAVYVPPAGGGLDVPQGLAFGPDGNLYVASTNVFDSSGDAPPGAVLKFAGPSSPNPGASLGTFVPGGYGGLANPLSVLFGPGGDLFVSSCQVSLGPVTSNGGVFKAENGTSVVLRYDGTTGAFLGTFVAPDSGGLRDPFSMTFTETDPTTLNYDGATTSTALIATPMQPAGTRLLAGPPPVNNGFDPAALAVALPLSPPPAAPGTASPAGRTFTPAPPSVASPASKLPPAAPSQPGWAAIAASEFAPANLDVGLFWALPGMDLAWDGWRAEGLVRVDR